MQHIVSVIGRRCALGLALVAVVFPMGLSAKADDQAEPVKVMSFNIRFASAADGENAWPHRKEFVVETIRQFQPDLLGTQEVEKSQRDYLAEHLQGYGVVAAGRTDGRDRGEMSALFYRRDRFEKLDSGHFWLSETPDVPGSKSWDSSLPRMVSWAKLRDVKADGQPEVWFFNTHFDHRGPEARLNSAKMLHERVAKLGRDAAVIVTGDFNAAEGSMPYQALFAPVDGQPLLVDTFRQVNPNRRNDEGTFSGYKAERIDGARIDWIACTPRFEVESAEIDRTERDGRTPSDHFPVTAVLVYDE